MTQAGVERTLGQLLATVEGLQKSIDKAEESRTALHRRMVDLVDRTGELEGSVDNVRSTLRDVKSVTDQVTAWKQRGMGALAVTGIAASALTSALTSIVWTYWETILRALRSV